MEHSDQVQIVCLQVLTHLLCQQNRQQCHKQDLDSFFCIERDNRLKFTVKKASKVFLSLIPTNITNS